MVPLESLEVSQVQIAKAKAPIAVVVGQFDQPGCNRFIIWIELTFVAVARLADPKGLASHSDTDPLAQNRLTRSGPYVPSQRLRPSLCVEMASPFYSSASETISALSFS